MNNDYNKIIVPGSTCKCTYSKHNFEQGLVIEKCNFCVMGNKHWYIEVSEKAFNYSFDILSTLSAIITNENSSLFNSFLKSLNICDGLSGFSDVIQSRLDIKQPLFTENGNQNGIVMNDSNVELDKKFFNKVRHIDCKYFIQNKQICEKCFHFANSLRSTKSRYHKAVEEPEFKKQCVSVSSTTNLRYLTREELVERLNNAQNHKLLVIL